MKRLLKISAAIIIIFIAIISIFLIYHYNKSEKNYNELTKKLKSEDIKKFNNPGTIKSLSILPLIDFYSERKDLKTEAGVSYLIKADDTTILMDVGFNEKKEHPSPLIQNMKKLGVNLKEIEMIFVSHGHADHLGGMTESRNSEISLSQGKVDTGPIKVFSPEKLSPSKYNPELKVRVLSKPEVLKPGIASSGVLDRYLFIMGITREQSLIFNLKGKGLVIVIGCGHPTAEKIISRAKELFDKPVYGVIGGLHYPINGGRYNVGPLNVQYIVGAENPFTRGLSVENIYSAINVMKKENLKVVSISPHDSSDRSIEKFKKAFRSVYVDLRVGKKIVL